MFPITKLKRSAKSNLESNFIEKNSFYEIRRLFTKILPSEKSFHFEVKIHQLCENFVYFLLYANLHVVESKACFDYSNSSKYFTAIPKKKFV